MRVERKPVITDTCIEQCAMARLCRGVDPVKAVALAMDLADRPYGGCVSDDGPVIDPKGERCHLDPDVQVVLTGIAAGMGLQAGESLNITGSFDESLGRLRKVQVAQSLSDMPTLVGQSAGYMR